LGAIGNLDRNFHPHKWGGHFKINTFRALSRSLLAPSCEGDFPQLERRDRHAAVPRVGETGFARGVDMTDEILDLARYNAAQPSATNVEFLEA
jgi:hypothetical protein